MMVMTIMMISKEDDSSQIYFQKLFNLEGESSEDLAKFMKVTLWNLNPPTLPNLLPIGTELKELDKEVGLPQRDLGGLVSCEGHHLLSSLDNIGADANFLHR